eukprot:gene7834-393_t
MTAALLLHGVTMAIAARQTVNFDFGWRHTQSIEPRYGQCGAAMSQQYQWGQGYIWQGRTPSWEECCNECANRETCRAWDWNGRICYVKDNAEGPNPSQGRWAGKLELPWPAANASTIPPRAQVTFNDEGWGVVDAPHDMARSRQAECLGGGRRRRKRAEVAGGGGDAVGDSAVAAQEPITPPAITPFVNNCSGWYRKHFALPAAWKDGVTWVYFEGIYHTVNMWFNGKPIGAHINGYTQIVHRLDDKGANFGEGAAGANVISIFANAAPGTGYWYAGGGLSRHQYLVHTPTDVYLVPDMAWVHANVTDVSKLAANGATPGAGDRAEAGSVHVVAEGLISNAGASAAKGVVVTATFYDQTGSVVATERTNPLTVGALGNQTFKIAFVPKVATELWSVPRAYIYTASIAVAVSNIVAPIPHPGVPVHDAAAITLAAAADGGGPRAAASSVVDVVNVTYGVKHVRLDPDMGMYLNARRTKMRGYCDHSTFGGVGSAVPDRVQLYKAQTLRAAGGNAWRMAHNPPVPARLDILDRIGMLALDENHFFGGE